MDDGSFIPVGTAANKVVIDMAARLRAKHESRLMGDLRGSLVLLNSQPTDGEKLRQKARAFNADRAKATITSALGDLRDNSSPAEAIEFLRVTLAANEGV